MVSSVGIFFIISPFFLLKRINSFFSLDAAILFFKILIFDLKGLLKFLAHKILPISKS